MSTGHTALSALCLCLAAGDASGKAVKILASRVVRHPEVPCALTLIPPLFQRADNDSATYPPRLFVFGKADWLNGFLRQFPSVASVYVFTTEDEIMEKFRDFFMVQMMPSASILLRVADPGSIPIPFRVRYIAWLSFDSNTRADGAITAYRAYDRCYRFFRVMVTARPRGTTHVFSVPMRCDVANPSTLRRKDELLGVWSPGAGWSAPHVPIFPPLCASWRPPPDGQPLLAEMSELTYTREASVDRYKNTLEYAVLRLVKDSYDLVFQLNVTLTTELTKLFRAADTCRLDVVALPNIGAHVQTSIHAELSFFLWEHDQYIGVVPVGAGKPRPVLYPLFAEYTLVVWAVLATVVFAVVACLYLMRRDESVQELVLQTLSPLLGQPLDDRRPGPQIAVLGGWLLTCVVLIGGYQGQLLGFITTPPQNGEINSWQEWLNSDLFLLGTKNWGASSAISMGADGMTEDRMYKIKDHDGFPGELQITANQKNVSYLKTKRHWKNSIENKYESSQWGEFKKLLSKIHTFKLPSTPKPVSSFVTTKGSPFEIPIRKVLGRIRAAGGLRRNKYYEYIPQATEGPFPISLINVMPVFAAYIAGNIFAVVTFLIEFFYINVRKFCRIYKIAMLVEEN